MAVFTASWYLRRVPQVHAGMRTLLAQQLTEDQLAAKEEVDEWCAPRLRTLPVTEEQLKRYRVVIAVDPPCHKQANLMPGQEAACFAAVGRYCPALSSRSCFMTQIKILPECADLVPQEQEEGALDAHGLPIGWGHYQLWWQTVLVRVAPELQKLGWSNIRVISNPYDPQQAAIAACADVIVTSIRMDFLFRDLLRGRHKQRKVILIEQYGASTIMLPEPFEEPATTPQVLSIVKHTVLQPPSRHNGPLIEQRAHLAMMAPHMKGANITHRGTEVRPWYTDKVQNKIAALLPMTYRFRYPLSCGGSWQFVRPLTARSWDVTFIGKTEYEPKEGEAISGVTVHRQLAVAALKALKKAHGGKGGLRVYTPAKRLNYQQYLEMLLDSKIVVSPWGWGEWSHKDFEIMMAGCLLVKPRTESFTIYPPMFEAGETVVNVKEDFSDLEAQVLPLLNDLRRAQSMADAGMAVYRKYSEPAPVAADWSALLLRSLGGYVNNATLARRDEAAALHEAQEGADEAPVTPEQEAAEAAAEKQAEEFDRQQGQRDGAAEDVNRDGQDEEVGEEREAGGKAEAATAAPKGGAGQAA
eukprot:scaffold14.g1117.t1